MNKHNLRPQKTYNEMAKPINNYEKVKCYNQGISEVEKGLVYIYISLSI